jgi:hypothetical protein
MVKAAGLQRLQRLFRYAQFKAGEPFHVLDPLESFEPDNRPASLDAG